MQWLSSAPAPIPDHIQIGYSKDEPARRAFAELAAADWEAFLSCRSAEMVSDAQLVIVTMASHDDGAFGYGPVLEAMTRGLEDLVETGLITPAEVSRMVIPTYARTRREFEAPFAS